MRAPASRGTEQAHWIGLSDAVDPETTTDKLAPNQWICFRKRVRVDALPTEAIAQIACDSKYWLWINGELVVFEGQLKRGPTPQDTYCDLVDLAPHLRRGENTIAVLLWFFGKEGFSHKNSGQPGFFLQADLAGIPLVSDTQWKVCRHPAYGETGKPHPNFRLPESNIRFDAQEDLPGWQLPEFDDSRWQDARTYGSPLCTPWGKLIARPIPLFRTSELREYENPAEITAGGETIVAKLPYNAQVTPYLKVDSPAGRVIDIRTDNYRGGGEFNVRTEYVTTGGIQEFESLGWMNGHEVHYKLPPDVQVLALKYRESGYDCSFAGSFHCDDSFLNSLWNKARRTLYVEMRDGFFDCPGRERAQMVGRYYPGHATGFLQSRSAERFALS